MSDFFSFSNFNELALIGAAAIVVISAIAIAIYFKSIKDDKSTGELKEGSWDGIKEYKNPLPLGWAVAFLVVSLWAIYYMCAPAGTPYAYPLASYSQLGEYKVEVDQHKAKFDAQWQGADEATLKNMGQSIFLVQCAQCHGITGNGIDGTAADLTQWASEAFVLSATTHGSKGLAGYTYGEAMPALVTSGFAESEAQLKLAISYMFKYVAQLKPVTANDAISKDAEAEAFMVCAACHGEDGKGMEGYTPDLTQYGKPAFVVEVLNRGKMGDIGDMPAFNDGRLTEVQKQAVGAYILSSDIKR
jgi:cytochrome c oxidase cbb3-type subunit 3